MGTSTFSSEMIKELLNKKEVELKALRESIEFLQNAILRIDAAKCAHLELGNELENWSEIFDSHDEARKKAMLLNVIERVETHRDKVKVTYRIKINTFIGEQNSENPITEIDPNGENCCMVGVQEQETALNPQSCGVYSTYPAA